MSIPMISTFTRERLEYYIQAMKISMVYKLLREVIFLRNDNYEEQESLPKHRRQNGRSQVFNAIGELDLELLPLGKTKQRFQMLH